MDKFFLIILSLVIFTSSFSSHADSLSFCGNLDFRKLTNSDLEQALYIENLSRGIKGIQCGLAGESLNICSQCQDHIPESSMQILRPVLGEKSHSDWHAKWHKIRLNADKISGELFEKLRQKGLVPARAIKDIFLSQYKIGGTLAGENFFYMHRMMIKMVQVELAFNGQPCISPWRQLPDKIDDANWPVPHEHLSLEERGRDELRLLQLKKQLIKYFDPDFLRLLTLNKLGEILEPELHQNLHEFYRGNPPNSEEALAQGFKDDLLPVETSPVNKYFWKIHGLIDEILDHWLKANGYQFIDRDCSNKRNCYQWEATWVGEYPLGRR